MTGSTGSKPDLIWPISWEELLDSPRPKPHIFSVAVGMLTKLSTTPANQRRGLLHTTSTLTHNKSEKYIEKIVRFYIIRLNIQLTSSVGPGLHTVL